MLSNAERAELERQRRQRQLAREQAATAESSAMALAHPTRAAAAAAEDEEARPAKRTRREDAHDRGGAVAHSSAPASQRGAAYPACEAILPHDRFWQGTVKRSWNEHTQDGCHFDDFMLPTTRTSAAGLRYAVLSCFMLDQMAFDALPSGKTAPPVTMVISARPRGTPTPPRHSLPSHPPNWTLVMPESVADPPRTNTMHVKLVVLAYADRMRLVISTGNFIPIDWQVVENVAFVQDFALRDEPDRGREPISDAARQLRSLLDDWGLHAHPLYADLLQYNLANFGGDSGARIVVSRPVGLGSLRDWTRVQRQGVGRMATLVEEWDMGTRKGGATLMAQGSSMGVYSRPWLENWQGIGSGLARRLLGNGSMPRNNPISNAIDAAPPAPPAAAPPSFERRLRQRAANDWPPIALLYPSRRQVDANPGGQVAGGTFHLGKCKDDRAGYGRLFHRPESKRRSDVLMHAKGILSLLPGVELPNSIAVDSKPKAPKVSAAGTAPSAAIVVDDSETEEEGGATSSAAPNTLAAAKRSQTPESVTEDENEAKGKAAVAAKTKPKGKGRSDGGAGESASAAPNEYKEDEVVGWFYFGSANFTQAAWGHLSKDKRRGEIQLTGALNWELGIAIPLRYGEIRRADGAGGRGDVSHALRLVDSAMVWRPDPAQYADDDEAWDYTKHLTPDIHQLAVAGFFD